MGKNRSVILSIVLFVAFVGQVVSAQRVVVDFVRPGTNDHVAAYVVDWTDESPSFPGGEEALRRYINSERNYPAEAYRERREGRVMCGFVVDVDGTICNITVQRSTNECFSIEAVRIIENMPKWQPGKVDGRKVPVYYLLPIPFRL